MTAAQKDPSMYGQLDYKRRDREEYYTEPWVTRCLLENWSFPKVVWEPAAGRHDISQELEKAGCIVHSTDLTAGTDFLECEDLVWDLYSLVTNPPYLLQDDFVECALRRKACVVAMLLRSEFDHAKKRRDFFRPPFACKLVLTKRPRWDWWERDKPKASPRHNFAWFIWDRRHKGEPVMRWA